jgi:hypothetical protein
VEEQVAKLQTCTEVENNGPCTPTRKMQMVRKTVSTPQKVGDSHFVDKNLIIDVNTMAFLGFRYKP